MESKFPPAQPKAAAGCLLYQMYLDDREADLHELIGTSARPLNDIPADDLCPGADALAQINASHR